MNTSAAKLTTRQLELLSKPFYSGMLGVFEDARTIRDAAEKLKVPVTRLHYHVKQLCNAGILKRAGMHGRSQLYQALGKRFSIPEALKPEACVWSLVAIDTQLRSLRQRLGKLIEDHYAAEDWQGDDAIISSNDEAAELPLKALEPYASFINFSELRLSEAQYRQLTETVIKLLKQFDKEAQDTKSETTKVCNISFIAFKDEESTASSCHWRYTLY